MFSFVETRLFTHLVNEYLSDDDYARLQQSLAANPEQGDLIRGSGGVRKMRWSIVGRGKREVESASFISCGSGKGEIWLLTLYAKNVVDAIPAHVLRQIRNEIEN